MHSFSNRFQTLTLTILIVFSAVLLLSGCSFSKSNQTDVGNTPGVSSSGNSAQSASSNSASSTVSSTGTMTEQRTLTLFFPTPDADGLVSVTRIVTVPNQEVIQAIFQELGSPPTGSYKPLPEGTKLLSATIQDGIAILDLSKEFQNNFTGGSAGEQMTYFSIVNSLTSLSNIQSVQFLLEGKKLEAILGNYDTMIPMKRNESLIQK